MVPTSRAFYEKRVGFFCKFVYLINQISNDKKIRSENTFNFLQPFRVFHCCLINKYHDDKYDKTSRTSEDPDNRYHQEIKVL